MPGDERKKILAIDPKNIEAHILKGNALAGLKDFKGALSEIQQAIQTDPDQERELRPPGRPAVRAGRPGAGGSRIQAGRSQPTRSRRTARLALANLYWSTNRRREAEEAFKEAATLDPANVLPNQALAMLYLGTGRMAEAEAPLKSVAEHSKGFEGKIMLADYYANVRRLPEAKAIYEAGRGRRRRRPTAKLRLASLGLMEGDRAGAYRLIDEILAKDPEHVEALGRRAPNSSSTTERRRGAWRAREAAVAADPNVAARAVRAWSDSEGPVPTRGCGGGVQGSRPRIARVRAGERRTGPPRDRWPAIRRCRQLRAGGDRSACPGYGEAYLLLARAQIANGNPAGAETP